MLLLYPIPEDGRGAPPKNYYRHYFGRLHRPQDFQFLVDGMTRILNQPVGLNHLLWEFLSAYATVPRCRQQIPTFLVVKRLSSGHPRWWCSSGKLYNAISDLDHSSLTPIARTTSSFFVSSTLLYISLTLHSKAWSGCVFSLHRQWASNPILGKVWTRNSKLKRRFHKAYVFLVSGDLMPITWSWFVICYSSNWLVQLTQAVRSYPDHRKQRQINRCLPRVASNHQ